MKPNSFVTSVLLLQKNKGYAVWNAGRSVWGLNLENALPLFWVMIFCHISFRIRSPLEFFFS